MNEYKYKATTDRYRTNTRIHTMSFPQKSRPIKFMPYTHRHITYMHLYNYAHIGINFTDTERLTTAVDTSGQKI